MVMVRPLVRNRLAKSRRGMIWPAVGYGKRKRWVVWSGEMGIST